MRKRKSYLILVVSGLFLLSGCGAELLIPVLFTGGSVALTTVDVNEAMKQVDYKGIIEADFNRVWQAAVTTIERMGVAVSIKKLNEKENGGIITGQTETHQKIEVIIATVTSTLTNVGIKARVREFMNMPVSAADVDIPLATKISRGINEELGKM